MALGEQAHEDLLKYPQRIWLSIRNTRQECDALIAVRQALGAAVVDAELAPLASPAEVAAFRGQLLTWENALAARWETMRGPSLEELIEAAQ